MSTLGKKNHVLFSIAMNASQFVHLFPPQWKIMTWQKDVGCDDFLDSLPLPNIISSELHL